jgi:HD-GYP domain-containing protein (c-di-GMP phosphodiesterase class II)
LSILETVGQKDLYTDKHARAVARLSRFIGLKMGLSEREMQTLLVSALLHDVGKVVVPDAILKKPGPLTPEEREVIKLHPVAGSRILQHYEAPPLATIAVRHHHERYDGDGYPDGLRGEEIPLAARIVLVADAFDALTRGRSYRRSVPPEETLEEIERNAGTQFDPEVVGALAAVSETQTVLGVRDPWMLSCCSVT